jgi:hypothetical protein
VSEVLGHASIAITKDVYGHLLEGDKRAAAEPMSRRCSAAEMRAWLPAQLPEQQERPLRGGQGAFELGALGGTRTPNLLTIRRSMEGVRPVRRNPNPQVSFLLGVRHRRHSPAPSGQSVRKL